MEELGITIQFQGETLNFDKSVSGMEKAINTLKKEVRMLNKDLKVDPKNIVTLTNKMRNLYQQLVLQRKVSQDWRNTIKQLADDGKQFTTEWTEAHAKLAESEDKARAIKAQLDKVANSVENAKSNTENFAEAMFKVSDVAGRVAEVFEPISRASRDFLKDATESAIDFEDAFADVKKTVKSTGIENLDNFIFSELENSAKELSTYLPISASEIAKIMGLAGQMNVPANQIRDFTEAMIKFGDSTNINATDAVTDIAQIYNVIGKGGDFSDLNNLLSTIVELGNNSATTEKDITTMFRNISAGASRVGMTEAQMVALSATLSSLGLDKGGASAISTIMTKIDMAVTDNGKKLQEWAKVAGMSSQEFKKAWSQDSANALLQIVTGMSAMTDEGISMNSVLADLDIKELRQIDTLSRLANANGEYAKNIELANSAYAEGTALSIEAEKRYSTLKSQIEIAKNNFTLFAISIGELVMPYVQQLIDGLMQVADWLNNLDPEVKDMIMKAIAVTAVIAPIFSLISKIAGAIASLTLGWIAFKIVLLPVLANIATFIASVFKPFVMFISNHPVLTAITLLIGGLIYLYNHCEAFREIVQNIIKGLKELWEVFKTDALDLASRGFEWLGEKISGVIGFISSCASWFGSLIAKVKEFASSIGLLGGIGGILGGISGALGGGMSFINSGGFGALNSGGFNSGGITLNANFSINSNNITRRDVKAWSEWIADDINEALGRRI